MRRDLTAHRPEALVALEARIKSDLDRIAHPRLPWLEPRIGPDGDRALDVIVVGGGQSGLATAFGLMRSQVRNLLVVDKADEGQEGPWLSYARMPTLRSPKDFTGPDLDVPSLTYQSWHEARYGEPSWEALGLIRREDWAAYLLWFRHVAAIPVENGSEVVDIAPAGQLLAVTIRGRAGGTRVRHARKVVLATGQEGAGRWETLPVLRHLPSRVQARTGDAIDFGTLAGRRVAVIGAGASAFDNAASALEAGAREVHLLCRRDVPQVVQPFRWLSFTGFLRHLSDLDDAWRWRFMRTILSLREGFPQATYDRCTAHDTFRLRTGSPVLAAAMAGDAVELTLPGGVQEVDFIISATGIEIDFAARPELARIAGNILTWADRYHPPPGETDARLGAFPYLSPDHALMERNSGETPWIENIHFFAIASTMSFGPSGSSINAMTTAVPKLVAGVTRGLFKADLDRHWASLLAYDVPQAILDPDKAKRNAPQAGTGLARSSANENACARVSAITIPPLAAPGGTS